MVNAVCDIDSLLVVEEITASEKEMTTNTAMELQRPNTPEADPLMYKFGVRAATHDEPDYRAAKSLS